MSIAERITALRALMADRGYDVYMVPTDDTHQSEYVGEHFKEEHSSQDLPVLPEQQ